MCCVYLFACATIIIIIGGRYLTTKRNSDSVRETGKFKIKDRLGVSSEEISLPDLQESIILLYIYMVFPFSVCLSKRGVWVRVRRKKAPEGKERTKRSEVLKCSILSELSSTLLSQRPLFQIQPHWTSGEGVEECRRRHSSGSIIILPHFVVRTNVSGKQWKEHQ